MCPCLHAALGRPGGCASAPPLQLPLQCCRDLWLGCVIKITRIAVCACVRLLLPAARRSSGAASRRCWGTTAQVRGWRAAAGCVWGVGGVGCGGGGCLGMKEGSVVHPTPCGPNCLAFAFHGTHRARRTRRPTCVRTHTCETVQTHAPLSPPSPPPPQARPPPSTS